MESGKLCYNHIKVMLLELGLVANPEDECAFNECEDDQQMVTLATLKTKYKDDQVYVRTNYSYLGMSMDFTKNKSRVSPCSISSATCLATRVHKGVAASTVVEGPSVWTSQDNYYRRSVVRGSTPRSLSYCTCVREYGRLCGQKLFSCQLE